MWKQCADLPVKLGVGKTAVVNGKVYCAGVTEYDVTEYIVYCYDSSQDKWTTLLPLPVRYFGLGRVNGKLVAVGGHEEGSHTPTNAIYTYEDELHKWKTTIPPMPTAREFPGVLSLQSALVVAGGSTSSCLAVVEIFQPDTSQWYKTSPLPIACEDISLIGIGDSCYALGGYTHLSHLNQALYASVDDLLHNAIPADQTSHDGVHSDTQSAWKALPNTPAYGPAAAVLIGSLIAIGGNEVSTGGATKKEIYMYSPSAECWVYTSDLPSPRVDTAVVELSSSELILIGDKVAEYTRVSTMYIGSLKLCN